MPGINDYRENFPQYNDLTDDELTQALYQSDESLAQEMDFNTFSTRFRGSPIEPEETPTASMEAKIDGALQGDPDPLKDDEEKTGFLSNAARLAGERASTLGGNLVGGLADLLEPAADWISEATNTGMGVMHDAGDEKDPYPERGFKYYSYEDLQADPVLEAWVEENRWANSVPRWLKAVKFGGEKRFTPDRIKKDYAKGEYDDVANSTVGFIFETGLQSVPDMIAAMFALPAYITSRSGEIGEKRAKNKGKTEADPIDVIEAIPVATASAILERIGAKGIFNTKAVENIGKEAVSSALKNVAKHGAKAGAKEAITEALQEGVIEYVGERFGTDAQMKIEEALEKGAWGALAGGGFGGSVGASVKTIQQIGDTVVEKTQPDDVMDTFLADPVVDEPVADEPVTMVEDDILGPEVPTLREPIDPRLKREGFRQELLAMTTDLVEGGGIGLIPDPNFRPGESDGNITPGDPNFPMIRTPSINPGWFQALREDTGITTAQTTNAVRKALEGIRLGPREEQAVRQMLDFITGTREQPVELEAARAELEARRFDRREGIQPAAPIEVYNTLAETYLENEYLPDMDIEARMIFDLAEDLEERGGNPDPIIDAPTDNATTITELETAIEEATSDEAVQTGVMPTPDEQTTETQTEATLPRDTITGEPVERRINDEQRARIAAMSPDEVYEELYTDRQTGLGNRRGFDEALPAATAVASIDGDYLKAVNDNLGHEAGDAMLAGIGRAIQDVAGFDGYRVGGDEFYILGDNQADLDAMLEAVQGELDQMRIRNDRGELMGFKITAGTGADRSSADLAMETAKKARPARGAIPDNMTIQRKRTADVEDLGLEPGSDLEMAGRNYSPNIDKMGDLPLTPDNEYRLGDGRIVRIPKKPVRREHIIKMLEKAFGLGIYEGRVKGKTTLGFYRVGQGAIRIKSRNDLETTAHEFGHWIDDRHPWVENLYKNPAFREEMQGVSYDTTKLHEGYAEFMRLWFTQDVQARNKAPQFYDAFMAELKQHPDLAAKVGSVQEAMHAWHLQGVRKRLASKIGDRKLPWSERFLQARKGAMDNILTQAFDRLRPIKQAERAMTGQLAEGVGSAWKSFTLAKGSRAIMEAVYLRGTIGLANDGSMAFTGKGLKSIFDPVSDRMELMQFYMVARRAQELMSQGRENLFRVDEVREGLELARMHPEFEQVFDEFQAFNKRMMDFYEAMGVLGSDTRQAIEEMNQNYVPFNRIIESAKDGKVKTQSGGSPFQRLRGGTGNINDVMESTIANHSHLITFAMNNRAKRTFYDMIDRNENQMAGQFATKIPTEMKPRNIPSSEIKRAIANGMGMTVSQFSMAQEGFSIDGQEAIDAQMVASALGKLDEMVKLFEPGIAPEGDVDVVIRNGKKEYYEVHDAALLDSLANLGPQATNMGMQMLGGFSNTLRRGVTSWPGFQVRNFMRDTGSAWTLSRGQTIPVKAPVTELLRRFVNDEAYWDFVINGGGIIGRMQADGFNADKVVFDPNSIIDKYDDLLGYAEYANRIAEFKSLTDKGVHPTEAAFAGRQISTDFAMRGRSDVLRYFTVGIPFLNARMQSLYRLGREVAEAPPETRARIMHQAALKFSLRAVTAITIPSMLLYFYNKDDERYKEMPDYIRDLYWVFFTGDGEDDYFLLPKPFEVGTMFGTMPERIWEYIEKRDGKELVDAAMFALTSTFKVDPELQIIKPLLEVSDNEKWTGAPIVPRELEQVAPQEQYRTYTSDAMIALGRKLGISPLKAEHIVKGYFGQTGQAVLNMADTMVGDLSQGGVEPSTGWEDAWWNPISSLVNEGPLRRTNSEQDFYDFLKLTRIAGNTQHLLEERSPERLMEYILSDDVSKEIGLGESFDKIQSEISRINNARDQVAASGVLSADDKKAKMDQLQRAKNQIFREFMDKTRSATRG